MSGPDKIKQKTIVMSCCSHKHLSLNNAVVITTPACGGTIEILPRFIFANTHATSLENSKAQQTAYQPIVSESKGINNENVKTSTLMI